MATLQLNQTNTFRQNAAATAVQCTFLVKGSSADVEVRIAGGALVGSAANVQPGNIANIPGLVVGTMYTYQINPHGDPNLANATVTY